jgi:hypothetical protein
MGTAGAVQSDFQAEGTAPRDAPAFLLLSYHMPAPRGMGPGRRGVPHSSHLANGQTAGPDQTFSTLGGVAANDLPRRRRQLSKFPADGRFPISWHHGHASAGVMRDLLPSFRLGSEAGRGAIGWDKHDVEGRAPERFSTVERPGLGCGARPRHAALDLGEGPARGPNQRCQRP